MLKVTNETGKAATTMSITPKFLVFVCTRLLSTSHQPQLFMPDIARDLPHKVINCLPI